MTTLDGHRRRTSMKCLWRTPLIIVVISPIFSASCGKPQPEAYEECVEYDPVKAPDAGTPDPLPSDQYPQIAVLDGLAGELGVGKVVIESGPPMRVTVPIRALGDYEPLVVRYRFLFFNDKKLPLDPDPVWHSMQMPARTQVFMQSNALDSGAVDWRLEIRRAV